MQAVGHVSPYVFQHGVALLQHVMIPIPQHNPARRVQSRSSCSVFRNLLGVLATVEFDGNAQFHASEVDDVSIYRMLSSEARAVDLPMAEPVPQQ